MLKLLFNLNDLPRFRPAKRNYFFATKKVWLFSVMHLFKRDMLDALAIFQVIIKFLICLPVIFRI
ncbi:MAG TPA: hypothetical protein DCY50_01620 [Franconibacter helveticus]|nr:hypothetical protein [Franconibacter helveticus]